MSNEDNNFDYTDKTKNLYDTFHLCDTFRRDLTEGYESPITGFVSNIVEQFEKAREDEICATIKEQYAIDVNREELIKALNYDRGQYNKGYSDGYKEAERLYARKWIPVSERLPEINVDVIVTDIETTGTYSAYYLGDGLWECDNGTHKNRIIAWQPLPEPYKDGDEE